MTRARRPARRPAVRLAATLAAALLLAGCTADPVARQPGSGADTLRDTSTGSPSSSAAAEPPPAPPAGACYRLPFAALTRPTSAREPVGCDRRHDAQTFHVGTLDLVVDGHALAVDSDRAIAQLERTCPRRLAELLGGTPEARRLTRLQATWFAPTLAQSDRGARWFRCDVVAVAGPERLAPLPPPRQLRGLLDRPGRAATYALCGTAAPGNPAFERVTCGRPHRWRAVATLDLPDSRRYPGVATVRRLGDERCRELVRDRAGDPLRFRYGWEWPTREQWQAGRRYGFCWAPD